MVEQFSLGLLVSCCSNTTTSICSIFLGFQWRRRVCNVFVFEYVFSLVFTSFAPQNRQLSPEMYDYNQWGNLYYEVFLRFVEEVLEKWKELEVAHSLTVVFFCRTYFRGNKVCGGDLKAVD